MSLNFVLCLGLPLFFCYGVETRKLIKDIYTISTQALILMS